MNNSKNVTSWFVTLTPDGIYHLTFNTVEKWTSYHQYNDTTYIFGEEENEEMTEEKSFENWASCKQEIPEFLPEIKDGTYLRAVSQNKDQITFLFIPYYHKWIKEGLDKIIMHSKDLTNEKSSN